MSDFPPIDQARAEPVSIIFIGEVEALVPARRDSQSTVMQRVVPQILAELEGFDRKKDSPNTLLFIGDYLDRGKDSAGVVRRLREELPRKVAAEVVTLRGNHEDAWLTAIDAGNPGFVLAPGNGCLATMRSFAGGRPPAAGDFPTAVVVSAEDGTYGLGFTNNAGPV